MAGGRRKRALDGAIRSELRTLDEGASVAAAIAPALAELLDAESSMALGWTRTPRGLRVDSITGHNFDADGFRVALDDLMAREVVGWAAHDPSHPEPAQRNRVVALEAFLGRERLEALPVYRDAARPVGLDGDMLRVVVCEGGSTLAWIGAYREEPFTYREVTLLQSLVPDLERRLTLERLVAGTRWTSAAMAAALEEVPRAAYVLGPGGSVVHANAAGRDALERDATELEDACAGGPAADRFAVTTLAARGVADHVLAIAPPSDGSATVAARAARHWRLSPRQGEVLAHLANGRANKAIAAELRIAESTVEVHVSTILRRAQCASRAELIVAINRDGACACCGAAAPRPRR